MKALDPNYKIREQILKLALKLDISCLKLIKTGGYGIELNFNLPLELNCLLNCYFESEEFQIPKHLHQVWIGSSPPPYQWINSFRKRFRDKYPDWKYSLWREEDIARIPFKNRHIYDDEHQLSGKVNILRYELLYQFGGIYIDADMEWLNEKPLDDLIENSKTTGFFAGKEDNNMLANSVIGSVPENPVLGLLIYFLEHIYLKARKEWKLETWQSTGPRLFSEVSRHFPITIFPQYYFYPKSWLKDLSGIDTTAFWDSYMIQYGYTTNGLGER